MELPRSVFSDFRDNSFEVSWDCQSQATTAGRDSAVHPEERCVRGASYWFGKISNFPSDSRCLCTFVLSWIRLPCKSYITSDLSVAIPMKVPIWMSWRHIEYPQLVCREIKWARGDMTSLRTYVWMAFGLLCHWFFISIFEVSEVYLKSFYEVLELLKFSFAFVADYGGKAIRLQHWDVQHPIHKFDIRNM